MGVDYELFWTLNPKTMSPFVKAFHLQQKREDYLAWQHGAYIKLAIMASFDSKGTFKYPKEPISNRNDEKRVKKLTRESPAEIKRKMLERMAVINAHFAEKSEPNG